MKKNIIKLIVVIAVFAIGYKVVNYIFDEGYRQGFSKTFVVNEKLEEILKNKDLEKNKIEPFDCLLIPQCSMNDCPEYQPLDVDGDGKYESVVKERTAMTQQAGRIWIIDEGKVIFRSAEKAQISFALRDTPDKQSNGFIISYATESPTAGEKVFKDSFKKDYYLFKDGKLFSEKTDNPGLPITYYGYVSKISTSGEARFRYFDIKTNDFVKPETQYSWYWAMPINVPYNETLTDKWVKFVKDNIDSVFKITGTRGQDDCDYWGPDHCVENIDVTTIEVVGTNKSMKF